jgi:hypothetical protein
MLRRPLDSRDQLRRARLQVILTSRFDDRVRTAV